jgi:hypothetical protein
VSDPPSPQAIFQALDRFQASLEHPYKMTPAGMWACSDAKEVYDLFVQMGLERFAHLCDLGSGDGRAVLLASLFTQATGIEADPELVRVSQGLARELGLKRARFLCGDCRQADLTPYDLLFLYPDKPLDWLEARLPPRWPGRLLVYGPYFKPQRLTLLKTLYAGRTLCGLWAA